MSKVSKTCYLDSQTTRYPAVSSSRPPPPPPRQTARPYISYRSYISKSSYACISLEPIRRCNINREKEYLQSDTKVGYSRGPTVHTTVDSHNRFLVTYYDYTTDYSHDRSHEVQITTQFSAEKRDWQNCRLCDRGEEEDEAGTAFAIRRPSASVRVSAV